MRLVVLLACGILLHTTSLHAQSPVSFPTSDGGIVRGDVYGTGRRGVVFVAHGGYSYKARWAKQARVLAEAGFRVLAFDTRAGIELERTGKETECLYDPACMAVDVIAAVRYLHRHGATTVSVVGGSAGAGSVGQASVDAAPAEIDRIVLLAPMPIATPEKMKGRKLFVVARDDRDGEGLRLPRIRDQYERAPAPKELVVLDGSAHGQLIFDTPQGDRLMREIVRFISER
jgi:dienelactone hydrolase